MASDPRKKEIELLQAEIERLGEQINSECAEIGRRLAESAFAARAEGELQKYLRNIQSTRDTVERYRGDIEKIRTLGERVEERRKSVEANQKRLRELERERETKYEEIGAAAYRKFKVLDDDLSYRELFHPVLDIDAGIGRHEEELRRLERDEAASGLIEKLLKYKTKKVVVRGQISRLEKSKRKAYFDVGKHVVNSDFMDRLRTELDTVMGFLDERGAQMKELTGLNTALAAEATQAGEELRRLGAEEDAPAKVREIEKRIEDQSRELHVMHCWAGQHFVEKDLRDAAGDDAVNAKVALIAGIRGTVRDKKRRLDVLRAEIEIDELIKKEKALQIKHKALEEEMRVKERQMNVVDIELSMGRRRLDELKHVVHDGRPYAEPSPLPPSPDYYEKKEGAS